MCGISGFIKKTSNKPIYIRDLYFMNECINHRGPDATGYFTLDSESNSSFFLNQTDQISREANNSNKLVIGLAHKRLSIVDLSINGTQPFYQDNSDLVLSFNGEIYNYKELKTYIESNFNEKFQTKSDTEVLYKLLTKLSVEKALNMTNGCFSFALVNQKKQIITLARDRFGVKPLYIYFDPFNNIFFGSEIKQFFELSSWRGKINNKIFSQYILSDSLSSGHETIYENVYQINSGSYVVLNKNSTKDNIKETTYNWYDKYFQFERNQELNNENIDQLKQLLIDSVKIRIPEEVNFGTVLSGGLDSSIVTLLSNVIRKEKKDIFKTFHFKSNLNEFDETIYYKEVTSMLNNSENFICKMNPVLNEDLLEKIIYIHDQPISNLSPLSEYLIYKKASDNGIKVILDGHGADEILGGYTHMYLSHLKRKIKEDKFKSITEIFPFFMKNKYLILQKTLNKMTFNILKKKSIIKNHDFSKKNCNDNFIESFIKLSLPKQLTMVDRNSLSNSIENRSPFLDYRIFEFLAKLRPEAFFKNGYSKFILREASKKILPTLIYKRTSKFGFSSEEKFMDNKFNNYLILKNLKWLCNNFEIFEDSYEDLLSMNSNDKIKFALLGGWSKKFKISN